MAYVLVYARVNEEEKIPRIGFVKTFRSETEAINSANDFIRAWNWSAELIYSSGNILCYADAYSSRNGNVFYETLTVKTTNSTTF